MSHRPCPPIHHSLRLQWCHRCQCKEFLKDSGNWNFSINNASQAIRHQKMYVSYLLQPHKRQHTSFLFVIVNFPFAWSRVFANLDQTNFTIGSTIEEFISCRNISLLLLFILLFIRNQFLGVLFQDTEQNQVNFPLVLLYNSKTDGGPGTSMS